MADDKDKIIWKHELIERFITGELKGEELEQFKKRMEADKDFAEEVQISIDMQKYYTDNAEDFKKRQILQEIYEEEILKGKSSTTHYNKKGIAAIKWFYKLAACIVFVIGIAAILFFTLRPPKHERLYAQYFKVYEASENVRGNNINPEDKFHNAMKSYEEADYKTAFTELNDICIADTLNTEAFFFKGISAMMNNNFDEATQSFKVVLEDKQTLYANDAEWYLSMCYLNMNDVIILKALLERISSGNSCYKDQSRSLLNDLE